MTKKRRGTDSIPFRSILQALMDERGLTMAQVGQLAGVSKTVVQSWLSGASPHDLPAVARLAKALGISFKGLLLGATEEDATTTVAEMFDEVEFYEGLCKVSIKKLTPRR